MTHGFAMYYTFGRMLLEGEDFRKAYDFEYFKSKIKEYGITDIVDMPNNIPTNALALVSVAWLPAGVGKVVWSLFSLVALGFSAKILFQLHEISYTENLGLGLATLVFIWRPSYDNIALGQMYFVVLFLFCLSMVGLKRSRDVLSSVPISLTFLLKGYGIVPLVWLGIAKHYKTALMVIVWILAVVLLTLPAFDVETWTTYYSKVITKLGTHPWLPSPVIELPATVVQLLSYLLNIVLVVAVLRHSVSSTQTDVLLSYSAAIAAGVITAPLAEEYPFVLFLPLVMGLAVAIAKEYQQSRRLRPTAWIFAMSILVMALPLRYKALQFSEAPLVLLAYPKLYAGIALLWCFKRLVSHRKATVSIAGKKFVG